MTAQIDAAIAEAETRSIALTKERDAKLLELRAAADAMNAELATLNTKVTSVAGELEALKKLKTQFEGQ